MDDALKERLKSVSLVITTLLTSLHDTTTENLNKVFKVATDNLDKFANTTERIMERVEQILEILADSPQVIVLITMSVMVLIASVISVLIGVHIMKLTKTLKNENTQNTQQNMQLFTERCGRAEVLFQGQAHKKYVPKPRETPSPGGVLTLTVDSTGFSRDNLHKRRLCLQ